MTKEKFISSILAAVFVASPLFAQSARPAATELTAAPAKTAAPQALPIVSAASLYGWQVRPNDMDGYFSSDIPQPVCGLASGTAKIFIFTNFSYYPSKNFHNHSNAVRVGEITTPADTYQLRSSNVAGDHHSLPGLRQEFATTSIATRARDMAGAVKCGASTYLIGGTYGHGTTFENRGMLVDKLGGLTYGPVKTTGIKITTKAQ